jgi:hypothetical protein
MLVLVLLGAVHPVAADDARVLPQGRWRVSAEARFSLLITSRFTPEGGTEDLATDFNRELNSLVFPDVQLVEAAFGLPAGSATFGRSVVTFE